MEGNRVPESEPPREIAATSLRSAFGWNSWRQSDALRGLVRWALIGIVVGVAAGFMAILFFEVLVLAGNGFLGAILGIYLPPNGVVPTTPYTWSTDPTRFFFLPVLMAGGGLAAGVLTTQFAPETAGHGTDEAIRTFHRGRGQVRVRVPVIKFVASVLTIGTGGSGGREGPTAQIGSGLGSLLARPLSLSTSERRVALMAGVGAGIGAIFKAPFGAALLSSEVLYLSDFEPDVIMPSIVASVISYSIFGSVVGFNPEFAAPAGLGWSPLQLPLYALLGGLAGLVGVLYVWSFYRARGFFRQLRAPAWAKPAIGAGVVGLVLAVLYYGVPYDDHLLAVGSIGISYGVVQWLFYQSHLAILALLVIVALIFLKIFATAFTVGSGGSAGLFGPGIVIGATVGFCVSSAFNLLAPGIVKGPDIAAFAVIGMMAVFGSVSKAPIAVILMVVEMTGSESILVPAMIAIFIAYYVAGSHHLYEAQVQNRLASPTHTTEYFAEFLRHVPVSQAMDRTAPTVEVHESVAQAQFVLSRTRLPVLAVLRQGELIGEVRLSDLLGVPPSDRGHVLLRDVVRTNLPEITPASSLLDALGAMDQESVVALLVIEQGRPRRLAGVIAREAIADFQRQPRSPA
ncbi:MAG: chloride channel protein [Thermoplasmata archaeon]